MTGTEVSQSEALQDKLIVTIKGHILELPVLF